MQGTLAAVTVGLYLGSAAVEVKMRGKMLTAEEIQKRLEWAQVRERRARSACVRLKRAAASADRRRENERKYLLGAALMVWSARDERVLSAARRWLASYVIRDADREALKGTPFEIPETASPPEASNG